ncbi:methionyl-tRNA formyltransferase [Haloarcula salinisoli]|uniref:Methionyl-tRNA formyltransferase n=1 Tax=Haloarcula salinisoli TaxID=2487746 RepID=A0A8J8CCG9_9EURY|nr:methionyl-tRNA formyltransferase [Halomicroarcula salinisoli]MBX0305413.1 methionyl-tRNA formyltransferase [Halomicroarcula salinisoli]
MRTVFVSHNDLGLACLEELHNLGADIPAIITRPRDESVADQTTFDGIAARTGADVHEVESVNTDAVVDQLRAYDPELLYVVGWSRLVEQRVLDIPSVAALGMHPAPLPRGRGRAPIAWNLIKGLDETALSMFHLVEAADAGDLVAQWPIDIDIQDDAASLYEKVVAAGRSLIRQTYPEFERGAVPRTPQDETEATWWPKRTPDQGGIDWRQPPGTVYDWIRGQSHPYPGAFSYLDGRKVTVWAAAPPDGERVFCQPGELLGREGERLRVGAWEGAIDLLRVQVADDEERPAAELLDYEWAGVGDVFESVRATGSDRP